MKMIKIRQYISELLELVHPDVEIDGEKHPRVHFQHADDDSIYPFLVFDLPNSYDDGSMENFVLEIDGWDNKSDTIPLETLMGEVDKELHRHTVVFDDVGMTFYRENRLSLTDPDTRLRRRKYVYQIRVHGE
ncbi:hypothetical protein [Sutcliffiella cohnii]|uniref:hypothetical protein n=1 Tax=Sutcliffiella cohnii TaxID=33932 RepID=UPI002E2178EE|nr:hypothetical protein [Sutcliffiella cohnii]